MSEHVWTQENLGAYLAGGLDPAEGERLEKHAGECTACAGDVEKGRSLSRRLSALFAEARPAPVLEDEIIRALPAGPPPRQGWRPTAPLSRNAKIILAAAAAVLLAFVGAGAIAMMEEERLRLPAAEAAAPNWFSEQPRVLVDKTTYKLRKSLQTGYMREPEAQSSTADNGKKDQLLKSVDQLAEESRKKSLDVLTVEPKATVTIGAPDPLKETQQLPRTTTSAPTGLPAPSVSPPARPVAPPTPVSSSQPGLPGGWRDPNMKPSEGKEPKYLEQLADKEGKKKADDKAPDLVWKYTNNGTLPALGTTYFQPGDQTAVRSESEKDKNGKGDKGEGGKGEGAGKLTGPDGRPGAGKNDPEESKKQEKPGQEGPGRDDQAGQKAPPKIAPVEFPAPRKIIIRTGELEFEIDSFDASVTTIMRLITASKGGFIATINSDKLANGKVRGSVVVRMPPEQLDKFILDLRKELAKVGELKNQHLGSTDVTKQYTDLESRLRAARTMEERLISIIKSGKGEIKDLLQAEKELGVWRTKIEEMEGEIRYYNNLASLSTLTIKLYEKEIRTAAMVTENERVQAGLEVEDVEKAYQEALKAIADAKGRVGKSELKQHAAGQFNAILHFEVSPESAGPTRDRLRQLGNMVRLQIDRLQTTENGNVVPRDAKVKRGDTHFLVSIYNLANVAPRETVILRLAITDVPATYQKLRGIIAKAKGGVVNSQLNEQDRQNINAQLDFHVSRLGEADILAALAGAGETLSRQVNRVPENDNVTDSKVLYRLSLVDADAIQPRETVTTKIAATDVPAAYQKLRTALEKVKARVINAQLNEQDRRNITAQLDFAFKRSDEGAVQMALAAAGESLSRQVTRLAEAPTVTDAKVLVRLELMHTEALPPRETVILKIAAVDVPAVYQKLRDAIGKSKGRVVNAELNELDRRNITANITFEIPRTEGPAAVQAVLDQAGEALLRQVARKQETASVTDTRIGFQVDFSSAATIPPREIIVMGLEVADVKTALTLITAEAKEADGRLIDPPQVTQTRDGKVSGQVMIDVPLSASASLIEKIKATGRVLVHDPKQDPKAPEGKLALARIVVVVSSGEALVPADKGLWSQVRHGLAFSLRGLSISASWLIVGLLFVLPWALLVYAVVWLARRMWRSPAVAATNPPPTA